MSSAWKSRREGHSTLSMARAFYKGQQEVVLATHGKRVEERPNECFILDARHVLCELEGRNGVVQGDRLSPARVVVLGERAVWGADGGARVGGGHH